MSVYYSDVAAHTDLTDFNPTDPQPAYTFTANAGHPTLTAAAEAKDEGAAVVISYGGESCEPARSAELTDIPVPDSAALVITVTVSKAGASAEYTVTVNPPVVIDGDDTSLMDLKVKFTTGDTPPNLLTGFAPETTDYRIDITNENDAERGLTITATPNDTAATVAITPTGALAVPALNGADVTVTVRVSVGSSFTDYKIKIVPPQTADNTDKTLSALVLKYNDDSDVFTPIASFSPLITSYTFKVPAGRTTVKISSLVTGNTAASAAVKYGPSAAYGAGNDTAYTLTGIAGSYSASGTIGLPATDAEVYVKILVTAQNPAHFQTYTIRFINPAAYTTWLGTVTIDDEDYGVSAVDIVTANQKSYRAAVSGVNNEWTLDLPQADADTGNPPVGFYVILTKDSKPYRIAADEVTGAEPDVTIPLEVTITAAKIALEVHNPEDLATIASNGNYYLAEDIDLTSLGDTWNGPNNYAGTFDGNGHTVRLKLTKTAGDTGLFNTLGNGAVIKNFNIAVSTIAEGIVLTNSTHFGGVIGNVINTGTYTIENVHVNGSLYYSGIAPDAIVYLIVGGLIGEIQNGTNSQNVSIQKCSVNLNITFASDKPVSSLASFGGLIGRIAPYGSSNRTVISDSYTLGKIDVQTALPSRLHAGGLVGCISMVGSLISSKAQTSTCYSGMEIKAIKQSGGTAGNAVYAGGLYGSFDTSHIEAKIENSVALNPKVFTGLYTGAGDAYTGTNENAWLAGRITTGTAGNGTLSGNYALSTMLIGDGNGAEAAENDTHDGINGASAAAAAMDAAWWTGTLGFDPAVWDFTGLNVSAGSYPKLKSQF